MGYSVNCQVKHNNTLSVLRELNRSEMKRVAVLFCSLWLRRCPGVLAPLWKVQRSQDDDGTFFGREKGKECDRVNRCYPQLFRPAL